MGEAEGAPVHERAFKLQARTAHSQREMISSTPRRSTRAWITACAPTGEAHAARSKMIAQVVSVASVSGGASSSARRSAGAPLRTGCQASKSESSRRSGGTSKVSGTRSVGWESPTVRRSGRFVHAQIGGSPLWGACRLAICSCIPCLRRENVGVDEVRIGREVAAVIRRDNRFKCLKGKPAQREAPLRRDRTRILPDGKLLTQNKAARVRDRASGGRHVLGCDALRLKERDLVRAGAAGRAAAHHIGQVHDRIPR